MRWSDYADAHAGRRLCCSQTTEDMFSRVEAHNWSGKGEVNFSLIKEQKET